MELQQVRFGAEKETNRAEEMTEEWRKQMKALDEADEVTVMKLV